MAVCSPMRLEHNFKKDRTESTESTESVTVLLFSVRRFLKKIFDRLDKKGTGELTLSDLMEGARS